MSNRNGIIKKLQETLDPERFEHSLRVEKIALALGRTHRVSRQKVSLAALLHDCARRYNRKELLKKARQMGLPIDPVKRSEPKLFHGEIGARLARKEFGIKDPAILDAVRHHTTGTPGMTKLEKIIYLADHLEEGRDCPNLDKLRTLAFKDLDQAVFESASSMLKFLLGKKLSIHPETLQTRNYYL